MFVVNEDCKNFLISDQMTRKTIKSMDQSEENIKDNNMTGQNDGLGMSAQINQIT